MQFLITIPEFVIGTQELQIFALQLSCRPKDDLSIDTGAPKRRVRQNSFVLSRNIVCV